MIVEVTGIEYIIKNADPRSIDELIRLKSGSKPIGRLVLGCSSEKIKKMYELDGWRMGIGTAYDPNLPVPPLKNFEGLIERPTAMQDKLVGPYILGDKILEHGLGMWIPMGVLTAA